jgi:hypothetical protein
VHVNVHVHVHVRMVRDKHSTRAGSRWRKDKVPAPVPNLSDGVRTEPRLLLHVKQRNEAALHEGCGVNCRQGVVNSQNLT